MSRIRAALLATLVLALPRAAQADVAKTGPEFQANTATGYRNRATPATAVDGAGHFVVVWKSGSYYGSGGDGSREGIFARHYDEHGVAAANEFQVNTYTTLRQVEPTVAAMPAGGFVIAWSSGTYYEGDDTQDGSAFGVFLRRFDSDGHPLGAGDQQVNTYTPGNQAEPDVATDAAGDFVVVWTSGRYGYVTQDGSRAGVFGQRFASSGTPAGGEFQVNTYTPGNQGYPAVSKFPGGGFVVVWQSPGQDGDRSGVFGQRFDAGGTRAGVEFQVNTHTTGSQYSVDVLAQPSGAFVVTWQNGDYYGSNTDGSGSSIAMRRFAADGTPLGGEVQVNTFTTDDQRRPAIAGDPQGNFVIAWESGGYDGSPDGSSSAIAAQHFTLAGTPVGDEVQVNTYTIDNQNQPAVAADGQGGFVVAWRGAQLGNGIFGQRLTTSGFAPPIPLAGTTLTLKDAPNAAKRKLVMTSRDTDVRFGGLAGSIDDPTLHGGSLRVRGTTFDDTYPLPAANWRAIGPGLGYEYRDPRRLAGPIVRVRLRAAQILDVRGQGAGLGHSLAANPRPVTMQLQLGTVGQRSCTLFADGAYSFQPGRSFKARQASQPVECPG